MRHGLRPGGLRGLGGLGRRGIFLALHHGPVGVVTLLVVLAVVAVVLVLRRR